MTSPPSTTIIVQMSAQEHGKKPIIRLSFFSQVLQRVIICFQPNKFLPTAEF